MEGVSEEFKEIYLELAPGHLFRAVRKKHGGCLCPKAPANQQASSQPHGGCGAALAHRWGLPGRVLSNGSWTISQSLEIKPVMFYLSANFED